MQERGGWGWRGWEWEWGAHKGGGGRGGRRGRRLPILAVWKMSESDALGEWWWLERGWGGVGVGGYQFWPSLEEDAGKRRSRSVVAVVVVGGGRKGEVGEGKVGGRVNACCLLALAEVEHPGAGLALDVAAPVVLALAPLPHLHGEVVRPTPTAHRAAVARALGLRVAYPAHRTEPSIVRARETRGRNHRDSRGKTEKQGKEGRMEIRKEGKADMKDGRKDEKDKSQEGRRKERR